MLVSVVVMPKKIFAVYVMDKVLSILSVTVRVILEIALVNVVEKMNLMYVTSVMVKVSKNHSVIV